MLDQKKLFDRAATILDERRWRQLGLQDDEGRVCGWGALWYALMEEFPGVLTDPKNPNSGIVPNDLIRITWPTGYVPLVTYNDEPGRTKEEVQARLRLYGIIAHLSLTQRAARL